MKLSIFCVVASLLCIVCVVGCGNDAVDDYGPNGYAIICDKGRECSVQNTNKQDLIVYPVVTSYCFVGNYIIGQNTFTPPNGRSSGQNPDYFIVDTSTGESQTGLEEQSWRNELQRRSIDNFELKKTNSKDVDGKIP